MNEISVLERLQSLLLEHFCPIFCLKVFLLRHAGLVFTFIRIKRGGICELFSRKFLDGAFN